MFRRSGFCGTQQNFGQRAILGADTSPNRVANAAKLLNYVQLNDRKIWLLQLGLSPFCAHELAVESLKHPEFNFQNRQQRWKRLRQSMGLNRQDEADAIVLRELRELLHPPVQQEFRQECPRTPTPPWNQGGNSTLSNYELVEYSRPKTPDSYELQGMTSTPLCVVNRDLSVGQPRNVYNIETNPQRMENNYAREQSLEYATNNIGYHGENNINEDHRSLRQFIFTNNYNYMKNNTYSISNAENNMRNLEMDHIRNEAPRNFEVDHIRNEAARNFEEDHIGNEAPRNFEANYIRNKAARNFEGKYIRNEAALNFEEEHIRNEAARNFRNDFPEQNHPNFNNGFGTRINLENTINPVPYHNNEQFPRYRNNENEQHPQRNFREVQRTRRTRKRTAKRSSISDVEVPYKKGYIEQQTYQKVFQIGNFKMPYIWNSAQPLPQPEHKSYAIQFFERQYNYIIGGSDAVPKEAAPKEYAAVQFLGKTINLSREVAKKLRRRLRTSWIQVYDSNNYKEWDLWWQDFKWCEEAIEKQLQKYEGINVIGTFLPIKIHYERQDSVSLLMKLAETNLESDSNNYHSIMSTIFELMNINFLQKLTTQDMGNLQHIIRYLPNHLWIFKMQSMVYIWSRYSRIQELDKPTSATQANNLYATQVQWKSPVFHWLAKQAFAELKLISQVEWDGDNMKYLAI